MNIVALHYKVAFFLDAEKSPRFSRKAEDKAINSAINDIVLDRYNNIRQKQKEYAFQTSQRLRDELYTIVEEDDALVATGDILSIASMTDYYLLLSLEVDISGRTINTIPLTYDEKNIIEINPFLRPSITYPERVYRIESAEGIKIIFGDTGTLVSGHSWFLKKPAKVSIGTEVSDTVTHILSAVKVIAYVDTTLNLHSITGGVISSVDLLEEEEYTIGGDPVKYARLVSGIVFITPTETDLPEILHEEIARKAAAILSGNVENYNREQSLERDIRNTE